MSSPAVLHPPNTPLGRFGIVTLVDSPDPFVASMPMGGLVNPITGAPTLGPLAVLVDYVAGLVNHHRRAPDEWTVSTELSLELTPDAQSIIERGADVPVVATAHPFGTRGSTSLGICEIAHGDAVIGAGTVRSVHVAHPGEFPEQSVPSSDGTRPTALDDIMALHVDHTETEAMVIHQTSSAVLNNSLGIVHGGIAAAGLELAASAALNAGRTDQRLHTASLRVSYLRQFFSGSGSRYAGTALRVGRRSGVAEARAIGADGGVALIATVTGYCR